MELLTATLVFILGATIGSFLSVVIFRLKHKMKGILFGRSIDVHTKKPLKPQHLIPILSFIFLRGKSPYNGKKISTHYIILEVVMGLLFLATYLNWNFLVSTASTANPEFLIYSINWATLESFVFNAVILSFLMAIFFYDLFYKEIPDRLSIPALGVALAAGLVTGTPTLLDMAAGALAIFLFFAVQFFLSKGKWIGGGDLRLGAMMGAILGLKMGILALTLSYVLGSVVSLALLASKKATRKTQIPFGPFLVTGTIAAMFFGTEILNWYLNLVTI